MSNRFAHHAPIELHECQEVIDICVMGRFLGTAEDCDDVDHMTWMAFGFEPASGVSIPAGDIVFDFEAGRIEYYDEDGETLFSIDMLAAIMHLPVEADLDFGGENESLH